MVRSLVKHSVAALVLCLAVASASADAYLRVIAQKASVRSGPGVSYREVYVAQRGQVFQVVERGTSNYWFKIELDDGTTGWILGDVVYPFEAGEGEEPPGAFTLMGRAIRGAVLGPSPVQFAHAGMSFSAGVIDHEGVFMLRPSWLIYPYWAVEGFAGLSPRSTTDVYFAGLGFTLRMIPGAVIGPYANLGLGAAHTSPKADNYVDPKETLMALVAGGGLEITLKKQITVRLDVRNWTIFNQNKSSLGQEYTAGLAVFF